MIWFTLTEEGLKKRIEGGERWVGYGFLLFFVLIAVWLYVSTFKLDLWMMVLFFAVYIGFVELGAYWIRRSRVKRWLGFTIGYENDLLLVKRRGGGPIQIARDSIQFISETEVGLRVVGTEAAVLIPYEMENFEDLQHRLRNWSYITELEDKWYRNMDYILADWSAGFFTAVLQGGFDMVDRPISRMTPKSYRAQRRKRVIKSRRQSVVRQYSRDLDSDTPILSFFVISCFFLVFNAILSLIGSTIVLEMMAGLFNKALSNSISHLQQIGWIAFYIAATSTVSAMSGASVFFSLGLKPKNYKMLLLISVLISIAIAYRIGYGQYF